MRWARFFLCFGFSLLCASCGTNVLYWGLNRGLPNSSGLPDVVRVYVDYLGDLYPADATSPDHSQIGCGVYPDAPSAPAFCWLMRAHSYTCAKSYSTLDGAPERCSLKTLKSFENSWREVQQRRWEGVASTVKRLVGSRLDRAVVILIHGFNNDFSSAIRSYQLARERIQKVKAGTQVFGDGPVFVEVYWDGRQPVDYLGGFLARQWGSAQHTGPLVGVSLRALVNALHAQVPLRILTHSSGAFVAASLLGDATAALPHAADALESSSGRYYSDYEIYQRLMRLPSYRVPQRANLRVGMLAAATPPGSFTGDEEFGGGTGATHAHLIFGMNQQDTAINKMGLGTDRAGATGMGTGGPNFGYYHSVREALARRDIVVEGYNFERSAPGCDVGDHAFSCYLSRECSGPFIADLMGWPIARVDARCRVPDAQNRR